jgi:hypothetical protein
MNGRDADTSPSMSAGFAAEEHPRRHPNAPPRRYAKGNTSKVYSGNINPLSMEIATAQRIPTIFVFVFVIDQWSGYSSYF